MLPSWKFECLKFDETFLNQRWISTSNFSIPFPSHSKARLTFIEHIVTKVHHATAKFTPFPIYHKNIEVSIKYTVQYIHRTILELPNCDNWGWWKRGRLGEIKAISYPSFLCSRNSGLNVKINFSFYISFLMNMLSKKEKTNWISQERQTSLFGNLSL